MYHTTICFTSNLITYFVLDSIGTWFYTGRYFHLTCSCVKHWHLLISIQWILCACNYLYCYIIDRRCTTIDLHLIQDIDSLGRSILICRRFHLCSRERIIGYLILHHYFHRSLLRYISWVDVILNLIFQFIYTRCFTRCYLYFSIRLDSNISL